MKIAISGKGGVGKTTVAAALVFYFSEKGHRVIVVDADPDANMAAALGIPEEEYAGVKPISRMTQLIQERTDSGPGTIGGFFKLNPDVSDIPETYSYKLGNINLLTIGTIEKGGTGCICPEGTFVKALVRHLVLAEKDIVIMDMEAGIEHLGRGTAQYVDAFIIVVEPGARSIQTANKIKQLAKDINIKQVFAVLNKIDDTSQIQEIKNKLDPSIGTIGVIMQDKDIRDSDLKNLPAYKTSSRLAKEISSIAKAIEKEVASPVTN